MKRLNFGLALAFAFVLCLTSCREQTTSSKVLINEVMMDNVTSATDEYGEHVAWIELFVKYYGPIDVAGYQLTVQPEGGQAVTYTIPKGDVITKVQPRQHILIWADGQHDKGTLHSNFTLDASKNTTIILRNSNLDEIDRVVIPAGTIRADQSWARVSPEVDDLINNRWEVKDSSDGNEETYVTPGSANRVPDTTAKLRAFAEKDPSGIGMAITAMTVVFSCLILLFIVFKITGTVSVNMAKKNELKAKGISKDEASAASVKTAVPGEVYAAIGMALHEMQGDVHDIEEMVLTMSNEEKHEDSPWSAKALTMRHTPTRK